MAAPVTMNSTLDNAGVLDPLLKFIVNLKVMCDSVYYSADNKKITSNYYPFLQLSSFLFIICLVILFIRMFLNFHSFLLSCSPHIVIYVIFNRDLIFDSWNVFQRKKIFNKNLVKFFLLKYFRGCRLKNFIHISQLHTRIKGTLMRIWKSPDMFVFR